MQGPKGKIPYIDMSSSSSPTPRFLGDSTLIIQKLVEEGVLQDLNAQLSPKEKVMDLAVRALLEDKLYFYQVSSPPPPPAPPFFYPITKKIIVNIHRRLLVLILMKRLTSMRYVTEL
jgi:hypothetical protein